MKNRVNNAPSLLKNPINSMRVSPIFKARDPFTYPTEYSSDDWHRAISKNFNHYVPHIPKKCWKFQTHLLNYETKQKAQ